MDTSKLKRPANVPEHAVPVPIWDATQTGSREELSKLLMQGWEPVGFALMPKPKLGLVGVVNGQQHGEDYAAIWALKRVVNVLWVVGEEQPVSQGQGAPPQA